MLDKWLLHNAGVPVPSSGVQGGGGQDVPTASPGGVPVPSSGVQGGGQDVPVASTSEKYGAVLPMPPRVVEPLPSPIAGTVLFK